MCERYIITLYQADLILSSYVNMITIPITYQNQQSIGLLGLSGRQSVNAFRFVKTYFHPTTSGGPITLLLIVIAYVLGRCDIRYNFVERKSYIMEVGNLVCRKGYEYIFYGLPIQLHENSKFACEILLRYPSINTW